MRLPALAIALAVAVSIPAADESIRAESSSWPDAGRQAAADSTSRSWRRVSSNNFVAVGDASEGALREALTELEVFRSAMFGLSSVLPAPRLRRTTPLLVLFRSDAAFTPFKPRDTDGQRRDNIGGYHLTDLTGSYMATYTEGPGLGARLSIVLHEYAHDIFHATLGEHLPPWLDEGLAELSGSVGAAGNSQITGRYLGRPLDAHVHTLRASSGPSVARMLETDGLELQAMSPTDATLFYAKSWALVHYLLLERSDRRADDVPAFLAALATGAPSATAFEQAFRVEMATIDTTLARYMQRMAFPAIRIEDVTAQLRTLTAERMLESDVDRLRGQLFLRLPDLPNADEALTRALARNPDSPATRVALARLRLVAHEALEAIELLAPATTADSGDATALVTLGRAQQQARRFDQALATFTRATLGDASGEAREEAWYGRSLAALAGGMPDEAVSAMAELQQIAPAARWYFRRARDLWAAGHDALAVSDVRTILESPGATSSDKSYAAFVGALSALRLDQPDAARDLLTQAEAYAEADWTRTVLRYMQGDVTDNELLVEADGRGEETEAHAYIGLMASLSGRLDEAREHLTWVRDRGWPRYVEYDMALAELTRLAH